MARKKQSTNVQPAKSNSQSEHQFRDLFEHMVEGMALHEMVYDAKDVPVDYRIIDVNPMFEKHTGLRAAEVRGKLATQAYGGVAPYLVEYARVAKTGKPYVFETFFPKLSRHFSISVYAPRPRWFATLFTDITDRTLATHKLAESEQRYRMVADFTYDWETWISPEGHILYSSPSVKRITGYSREEILNDPGLLTAIVHPDDRNLLERHLTEELSEDTSRTCHFDYRLIAKNGDERWMSHFCVPVFNEQGTYVGRRGSTRDITQRKITETSLAENESRLWMLFENSGTANAIFDRKYRLIMQNSMSAAQLHGDSGHAIGKTAIELFGLEKGKLVTQRMKRVISTGVAETFETEFSLPPSGTKWFRTSYQPLLDGSRKVFGIQVISQDITELKKMAETSQRADKIEALGVLAGGIAHDFNNLLGGIYGYLEMIGDNLSDENKVRACLDKAVKTYTRAKDLTRQLLTFSKGGAPAIKNGRIEPILQEAARFALSGSKVTVEFAIADDLRDCDFDENQIGQVVDNLVINAVQAMPDGGTITVCASNITLRDHEVPLLGAGHYLKLTFSDTGTGIPPDILPRIFDPFFTTKKTGNGLGLATCYSIISKHNGLISAESRPYKGSTFTVYLPAAKTAHQPSAPCAPVNHQGSGTILLMDDEDAILEAVGGLLENMGYQVVLARTGEKALVKLRESLRKKIPFAAVIMDLTIQGGMGGVEAVKELRKLYSDLPVFVASGYSDDPVVANPVAYGFTDKIEKPFRKAHLAELLERHLKK